MCVTALRVIAMCAAAMCVTATFAIAMCVTAMCAAPAAAQVSPTPDVDARRLPPGEVSVLRIDGLLDEAAWRDAPMASGFRQREPFEGEPATEITEVRVLFDDATLYVGVPARDRSPDELIARILQRDKLMAIGFEPLPEFTSDDAVVIVLDPFHDHRNAVVLGTNPNGAEFDAPSTNHAIARVKRDIGESSYLGAMVTDRRNTDDWELDRRVGLVVLANIDLERAGFCRRDPDAWPRR